jgi:hypothetical protein
VAARGSQKRVMRLGVRRSVTGTRVRGAWKIAELAAAVYDNVTKPVGVFETVVPRRVEPLGVLIPPAQTSRNVKAPRVT